MLKTMEERKRQVLRFTVVWMRYQFWDVSPLLIQHRGLIYKSQKVPRPSEAEASTLSQNVKNQILK
jgi:hypothetical protein